MALGRGFLAGLVTGAALTAVGILLLPSTRRYGRPLALAGVRSVMEGVDELRSLGARVREDLEDIVAEAEYERARRGLDREIAQADGAEPRGGAVARGPEAPEGET